MPVVDLVPGAVTGVEALVRWAHPQHSLVSPASFIPLAVETGLIVPIGAWVLDQATRPQSAEDLERLLDGSLAELGKSPR